MPVRTHRQPRPEPPKGSQVLKQFRLLQGFHVQYDPNVVRKEGESDRDFTRRAETRYGPGELVPSYEDLAARHGEAKFQPANQTWVGPNPYETQPAPGETEEEFRRRQLRLKAQREAAAAQQQPPQAGVDIKFTPPAPPAATAVPSAAPPMPAAPQKTRPKVHLEQLSENDLLDLAQAEEVEVPPKARKADIVTALRKAGVGG
jgi:hypothetical protein